MLNLQGFFNLQKYLKLQQTYKKFDANASDDSDREGGPVDLNGYLGVVQRSKLKLQPLTFDQVSEVISKDE